MALYSHFERYLNNLCNDVCESESLSLKRGDLRGQGIISASVYLKKVAQLNFPDSTDQWRVIEKLSKIRNFLVHDPGKIDNFVKNNPELLDYLWQHDKSWDNLIDSFNLMISFESIKNIINTLIDFSHNLDEVVKEHDNLREKFKHGPNLCIPLDSGRRFRSKSAEITGIGTKHRK
jgi:hypothetical protein